ncbi:MAG: DUF2066 domain-containing protein [Pseudomonadota bacterium]|nr:DUF2066 domain-containing protein [Pseudomonadota bacterium]
MHLIILSILIYLFALPINAHTQENNDTYTNTVNSKSQETLKANIKIAFTHTLSKRSGLLITESHLKTLDSLPNIETMVDRYDYTKKPCLDSEESACYDLSITFNHESIDLIMQKLGLSPWNGQRNKTLLWIQTKNINGDQILLSEHSEIADMILTQSKQRNMPTFLPIGDIKDLEMDLDEQQIIDFIKTKYDTPQILHGNITKEDPLNIQWHFYSQKQNHSWESQIENLDQGITQALDHIINLIKINTKTENQEIQSSIIEVKDLFSMEEYTNISKLLTTHDLIKKTDINSIGPDFIAIQIFHTGSEEALLQILQNAPYLQSNIESPNSTRTQHHYQWIPPLNQEEIYYDN